MASRHCIGCRATLASDAVALIAAPVTTQSPQQRFSPQVSTDASGFSGIDGLFRFRPDGMSERKLAVLQVSGRRLMFFRQYGAADPEIGMSKSVRTRRGVAPAQAIADRVAALDWAAIAAALDAYGCAVAGPLLTAEECAVLAETYDSETPFRSRIVMARHGFGRGEYKYFAYPLPDVVAALRRALYPPLAELANRWNEATGISVAYPSDHADYLRRCHAAGQSKPTPLLLRYETGDYNCLHQDVYGDNVFPLQATVLLSVPGVDFTGGEFVLTEQRPRMQSRAEVVPLRQGEAVIFAVRHRPMRGSRGTYRVTMRHGVSRLHSGRRQTLGIIFHDAA